MRRQVDAVWRCPARCAEICDHRGVEPAPYVEFCPQAGVLGVEKLHQIVQDFVSDGFVEGAHVPKAPDILLQRFQFHAMLCRDVLKMQLSEVRLPRLGAQAGEFRYANSDHVLAFRAWIIKGFQCVVQRIYQLFIGVKKVLTDCGITWVCCSVFYFTLATVRELLLCNKAVVCFVSGCWREFRDSPALRGYVLLVERGISVHLSPPLSLF